MFDFYFENLRDEINYGGHVGIEEYLTLLEHMDEENMKDWERRLFAEIKQLRLIQEDVKALQLHL